MDTTFQASANKRSIQDETNSPETKRRRADTTITITQGSCAEPAFTDARYSTFNHINGDQYINQTPEGNMILAKLKPVERGHYYVPPCLTGTREEIFEEIDQWLNDANASNILWLSGSPGAGKSTIASSLVSKLTERRQLGSRFFFKRGDVTLSDPASVWRTVASDLAEFDPLFADNLIKVLKEQKVNPGIADIALHFKFLIVEPLMQTYHSPSSHAIPVIVIDALDECDADGSQTAQRRALTSTLTEWSRLPKTFKIIITGRDDRTPQSFRAVCKQMTLPTGDGVSANANRDIHRFFEEHFAELGGSLFPEWPGKHVFDLLTARAAGLFIWAETVVKFVFQGLPEEQLDLVLAGNLGEEDNITKLYRQILESSLGKANAHTLEVFRVVISTIILAKCTLCLNDLHQIVLQPKSSVVFILDKLSSVISVRGTDQHLCIGHLSFVEFLCNQQLCPPEFYIDRGRASYTFVTACFRIMKAGLKFNICDLETSHLFNEDIHDLPQRIATKISRPLLYSCQFWAAHLVDTTIGPGDHDPLLEQVRDFFHVHLLFWLEVMSLTKKIPLANIALLSVARWLQIFDACLTAFAQDCSQFLVTFDIPISESAPHIYLSALPFSPSESLVTKQFLSQFPNRLVVSGGLQKWPGGTNIFRGHCDGVTSVAFSPDGKQVISGSYDNTVCVWDIETGQAVASPFEGHTDYVESVAFSPNGKQVVSGSQDCTICIWDIETSQTISGRFEGHTDYVKSVAFSPNGKHVASGSGDCTVCVWDIETGQTITSPLEGHTDYVRSVAFSPDGKWVVSGSRDCTVCVWDIETGQIIASPFKGHTAWVKSVAFLPDGKHVVIGSHDGTVCVWNVETGKTALCSFEGQKGYTNPVAFSPDAKCVASVSYDHTICVRDVETGQTIAGPFDGHTASINSVAFSLDGKQLVSGADDNTVHVWNVAAADIVAGSFDVHTNWVNSVAFLPNGKVVSISHDCTIHVWDVETGQTIAGPFEGHTDYIEAVAFSPNGEQLASGSDDCTVRVWDIETGQTISGPLIYHTDYVESVAFSPDGKWVVSGSHDCTACVWDVETSQVIKGPFTGHTASVNSVAFSPNGNLVVSGSRDHTICVWDLEISQIIAGPFMGHSRVNSVSFSPDGKLVVSGSHDHRICLWSIETGQAIATPFEGHTSFITSVKFSPDGKWLVSGSRDKTVRVWDVETGQTIAGPFKGHEDKVNSVSFSPDGKQVVSGSNDCTAHVWDVQPSQIIAGKDLDNSIILSPAVITHQTLQLPPSMAHLHKPVSIGGRCLKHNCTDAWVHSKLDIECGGHLFWAPKPCRAALHGADLAAPGKPITQINFSRFVHGTSWSQCYSPYQALCYNTCNS